MVLRLIVPADECDGNLCKASGRFGPKRKGGMIRFGFQGGVGIGIGWLLTSMVTRETIIFLVGWGGGEARRNRGH